MNSASSSTRQPTHLAGLDSRQGRVLLLFGLLAVEFWWFRRTHTTDDLRNRVVWWAPLFLMIPHAAQWGTAVLGTCLALDWPLWKQRGARLAKSPPTWTTVVVALGVHGLTFLAFSATTSFLLERDHEGTLWAWIGPLPWALFGLGMAGSWLLALSTPAELRRAGAALKGNLARGLAFGTALALVAAYVTTHWPYWEVLNRGTLELSHLLLRPVLSEQVYLPDEYILGPPEFPVVLTRSCSGYQGLSLFLVFFTAFLVIERRRLRFPNALLLLPLGALAAWMLNGLRVALLVLVGHWYSKEVAVDGFHKSAGWAFSLVVALGAVAVATRSGAFARSKAEPRDGSTVNPTAAYLGPLLALVGTGLLAGAFLVSPEPAVPLQLLVACGVLFAFRTEYGAWLRRPSFRALVLGALAAAVWIALHREAPDTHPLAWQERYPPAFLGSWWVARVALSCLVTPVAEELAFRGFLLRRLSHADFESVDPRRTSWFAVVVSSIAFGLLHPNWIAGTVTGVAFGLAYRQRGRVADAIGAHVAANVGVAGYAAASGSWWVWL